MSYRFKTDCVSATVFKVAQFRNQSVNQREGETMTTGSEDAEGFSKMIETNIWDSPYLDLVIIQNGVYHTKNVMPSVRRDAGVLFDAIYDGDIDTVKKMSAKYHNAFLTSKRRGTTRDRWIPVDMSKVRLFKLSIKYIFDLSKHADRG